MKLLVTGGAGFIASHFVRLALERLPHAKVIVLDALTYAGNLSTLEPLRSNPNFGFYPGKIQDVTVVEGIIRTEGISHIVNFAAESHNDRSILDPGSFIQTDVFGVYVLLEATRKYHLERMLHVSTDEVYGTIDDGCFTENSKIEPNTPYSASKAGGDLQVRAHVKAFGVPAVITRGGNTYGPYQYPEKLIPFFVTRLLDGKKVPLYGEGNQVREWIHAYDHAAGIMTALLEGKVGEVYNIGDTNERQNRDVVKILLEETGRGEECIKKIPDPRGGAHDKRYSMSADKIRGLGWKPEKEFDQELRATVKWYRENESWWRPITQRADFQDFINRFYGASMGDDL
jgi:dTDP-glucose 4,6-dehydratase